MKIATVTDSEQQKQRHARGENHWDVYQEEMFDELGVAADVFFDLSSAVSRIDTYDVLVLGSFDARAFDREALEQWVEKGGLLIGMATTGLDSLFGISFVEDRPQADDAFTINGYISMTRQGKPYLPVEEAYAHTLPVISDVRCVRAQQAVVLGQMLPPNSLSIFSGRSDIAAITTRPIGEGTAAYFGYSPTQTLCVLHQGRPVDRDWDGDGMYRSGDGIALTTAHDLTLPYADYHLLIIQELLDQKGCIGKYPLPPTDGEITELLLHYGGDDEADESGVQETAMNYMKSRDLPYHFNIMPKAGNKGFAVDRALFEKIKQNGQEASLHFQFVKIRTGYTKAELDEQIDLYLEAYGEVPIATVNHSLMFTGWTEQARWASARGIKGDAGRAHTRLMPDPNPINVFGTAFGTTYPHYVFDDHTQQNRRLPYVYIPIGFYEPRVRKDQNHAKDTLRLRRVLQKAIDHAWTLNMFYHPVYIARDAGCIEAIDQTLAFIEEKQIVTSHMGTDRLCEWWFDKTASSIEVTRKNEHECTLLVTAESPDGLIIRVPTSTKYTHANLNGTKIELTEKQVNGRTCRLLAVQPGTHTITLTES